MTGHLSLAGAMNNGLGITLASLEERRLQLKRDNGRIVLWAAGLTLLPIGWLFARGAEWYVHLLVVIVVSLICFSITGWRDRSTASQLKKEAVDGLLNAVLPDAIYCADRYIPKKQFNDCGLFVRPDRYNGKDYFEGKLGRTAFNFSLVHAEERYETTTTETDRDGHTTTRREEHWRDMFKGLLFAADFNKHFHGSTLVKAGKAGIFSGLSCKAVKLEDPRFHQHFRVCSSDQVEARYILTPRMMERLLDLRDILGQIELSFRGSWVTIAAAGFSYDAFEPDIGRSFADSAHVAQFLGPILTVVGIVEVLDLNTRIWTKQ